MNGVLIIDKPKGWTSHDVVARVRKVLIIKKAGHGGTLDPLATGVLPVYLNEGTKLVPFNLEGTKDYLATMKLGQETDTLDADGKVVGEKQGVSCTRKEIEEVLERFRGPIRQTPPLFSAIKQGGLPLYKRARAGQTPSLLERETMIHTLILKDVSLPLVTLEVTCGRGTYIRSLCADLGRALGCGAHLVELRRYRSGKFHLDQALSMEDFTRLAEQERVQERILPLKDGVEFAGFITVEERTAEMIRQGRPLRLNDLPEGDWGWLQEGRRVGLLHGPDNLLAIAESMVQEGMGLPKDLPVLRILRVFHN
ncbi:MAG: tRNA pseudouridine(55) synthase TruB [Deltaproteobacteria bacterium]|nr:tRNA pseudouridine(55) synthase TruB [Deltaproteobacteria bacterium]MDO9212166.1 tRNA pseudouridine(55) synthase TruB [Deltaproteobacteria bacterium]